MSANTLNRRPELDFNHYINVTDNISIYINVTDNISINLRQIC